MSNVSRHRLVNSQERVRRRKREKFSQLELDVLAEETSKAQNKLCRLLPNYVRSQAWKNILEKVNSVAMYRRTLGQVKKRWYDLKRPRRNPNPKLNSEVITRVIDESSSADEGGLFDNTELTSYSKELPQETQPEPHWTDCKLNGQLLPFVPMIKLEDIATHIYRTPLYCNVDLENDLEDNLLHLNNHSSPDVNDLQPFSITEIQDQTSQSDVLTAILQELRQVNAACNAMLTSTTQILSAVDGLTRTVDTMNHQQRCFNQRMLDTMERIAITLKKHAI